MTASGPKIPLLPPAVAYHEWSTSPEPVQMKRALPFVVPTHPAANRVHRPRWVALYPHGRLAIHHWCGTSTRGRLSATIPDGLPICGTCEGRAIAVGLPTSDEIVRGVVDLEALALRFDPVNDFARPQRCPASGWWWQRWMVDDPLNTRRTICPACGDSVGVRGQWQGGSNIVGHPPGPGLVDPCPRHGWKSLAPTHPAVCLCRAPRRWRDAEQAPPTGRSFTPTDDDLDLPPDDQQTGDDRATVPTSPPLPKITVRSARRPEPPKENVTPGQQPGVTVEPSEATEGPNSCAGYPPPPPPTPAPRRRLFRRRPKD